MDESISKEKVLREVRNSLISRVDNPYSSSDTALPVFPELSDDAAVVFADNLTQQGARFVYCSSVEEFMETVYLVAHQYHWNEVVCHEAQVREILDAIGIKHTESFDPESNFIYVTSCEAIIARHGSILLSSAQPLSRKALALANTQVIFALASQLHSDLQPALKAIRTKYKQKLPAFLTSVTGPATFKSPSVRAIPAPTGINDLVVFLIDTE
ncbi:MAG: hypothetical protein EOL88_06950 [Bacteroidia bacterium]|jgi:L-lactate dehydrogenase complex protein LldG|nr:hypothetical protein [Bacteroidales bacterium]NCD41813.1 hypothetical protein [Bacteroidia bacterium]MDD2322229.1 hypothetical protein [Bacteroidales bacterium]MDD3009783.1 hypothetical protein [Bacteroidales bacterium]MDD3960293.1 hypothetical protein [Bacteroidales bacterium]